MNTCSYRYRSILAAVRQGITTTLFAGCLYMGVLQSIVYADTVTLPWHPYLKPVVIGSAIQLDATQISPLNLSVNPGTIKWQNKSTYFQLLDYQSLQETLSKSNINAWAEAKFWIFSGKGSFDTSRLSKFQSNHRVWKVTANRQYTAVSPNPTLNKTALQYASDPTKFQSLFGNFAVTGIQYTKTISITFDLAFTSSYSETQFNSTIDASFKFFSSKGSADAFFSQLSQYTTLTITVSVEGEGSGTVISVASTGDLNELRKAVQDQLAQWDPAPADPNDAGNITNVFLTPYSNIPPGVNVKLGQSPAQRGLMNAIAVLAKLNSSIARLQEIRDQDRNLNSKTTIYLFGKKDKQGNHIDGTGKLDEALAKASIQYAYLADLVNGKATKDPRVQFDFQDPDKVTWRVLQAIWYPQLKPQLRSLYIELVGNPRVTPNLVGPNDSYNFGGASFYLNALLVNNFYRLDTLIVQELSFTSNLDPVTGLPHRYARIQWEEPKPPSDTILQLTTDTGGWFADGISWTGWPAPTLFIPANQFVEAP